MELIDTHAHLDLAAFEFDVERVLERARAAGVNEVIVPGVAPHQWLRRAALADAPGVHFGVGVHPQALTDLGDSELESGLDNLERSARIVRAVAIGECGLDGPTEKAGIGFEKQVRVLDAHIEVADSIGLPLILHVFRAHGEALRALKRHGPFKYGGVIHSYSGSAELVRDYVKLNLHISFAGAVTRPNAARPVDACRAVPFERLLIETDAPDQLPDGGPGDERSDATGVTRCEPRHVVLVAEAVARARSCTVKEVAALTSANARTLFGLERARA